MPDFPSELLPFTDAGEAVFNHSPRIFDWGQWIVLLLTTSLGHTLILYKWFHSHWKHQTLDQLTRSLNSTMQADKDRGLFWRGTPGMADPRTTADGEAEDNDVAGFSVLKCSGSSAKKALKRQLRWS